jgi:hypothetical protein
MKTKILEKQLEFPFMEEMRREADEARTRFNIKLDREEAYSALLVLGAGYLGALSLYCLR